MASVRSRIIKLIPNTCPEHCFCNLLQEVEAYRSTWPARVYLGMGGREFSGARGGKGQEHDAHFPKYLQASTPLGLRERVGRTPSYVHSTLGLSVTQAGGATQQL
jgi:hypothetical protein